MGCCTPSCFVTTGYMMGPTAPRETGLRMLLEKVWSHVVRPDDASMSTLEDEVQPANYTK